MSTNQTVTVTAGQNYTMSTRGDNGHITIQAPTVSFTRATPAYKKDGTSVASAAVRYDNMGKNLLSAQQASMCNGNTGGFAGNLATLSFDSDASKRVVGNGAIKVVTQAGTLQADGFYMYPAATITPSLTYTASVYLCGSGTVRLWLQEKNASGGSIGIQYSVNITLTDVPTRYSISRAFGATGAMYAFGVYNNEQAVRTWWYSGCQIEQAASASAWVYPEGMTIEEGTTNLVPNNCNFSAVSARQTVTNEAGTGIWVGWTKVHVVGKTELSFGGCCHVSNWSQVTSGTTYTFQMEYVHDSGTPLSSFYVTGDGAFASMPRVGTTNVYSCTNASPITGSIGTYGYGSGTDVDIDSTFYVRNYQCEAKSYRTSFAGYGGVRNAEVVAVPTTGVLSTSQGTVEMLLNCTPNFLETSSNHYIFGHTTDGANSYNVIAIRHEKTSNTIQGWLSNATGTATYPGYGAISAGLHRVALRWNASEACLFIDGIKGTPVSTPNIPAALSSTFSIGSYNGNLHSNAQISDVVISNVARSDASLTARGVLTPLGADQYASFYMPGTNNLITSTGYDASPGTSITFPTGTATSVTVIPAQTNSAWPTYNQLENKAYTTSWQIGGIARNTENVTVPTANILSPNQGTIELIVNYNPTMRGDIRYLFMCAVGVINRLLLYRDTGGCLNAYLTNAAGNNSVIYIADNATTGPHRIALKWDSSVFKLFFDGNVLGAPVSSPSLPAILPATIQLGGSGTNFILGSQISDVVFSNRARTDAELAARGVLTPIGVDGSTTYYLPLTSSINRAYPTVTSVKGMTIEEGTGNLLTANQAGVTTDLAGISAWSGSTNTRDTGASYRIFGSAAVKMITPGVATAYEGLTMEKTGLTGGVTYTFSAYVCGTGKSVIHIYEYKDTTLVGNTASPTPYTNTSTPTRISISRAFAADSNKATLYVTGDGTAGSITFYASGMQLEAKAYPTSWIDGGATRNTAVLTVPTGGTLLPATGTIEFLANIVANTKEASQSHYLFDCTSSDQTHNRIYLAHMGGANFVASTFDANGNTTTFNTPNTGVSGLTRFAMKWSATELALFINGREITAHVATPYLPFVLGSNLYIGNKYTGVLMVDSQVSDVMFSSVARSDEELTARGTLTPLTPDQYTTYYMPLTTVNMDNVSTPAYGKP
jgi:hypothetical protein